MKKNLLRRIYYILCLNIVNKQKSLSENKQTNSHTALPARYLHIDALNKIQVFVRSASLSSTPSTSSCSKRFHKPKSLTQHFKCRRSST